MKDYTSGEIIVITLLIIIVLISIYTAYKVTETAESYYSMGYAQGAIDYDNSIWNALNVNNGTVTINTHNYTITLGVSKVE